MRIGIAIVLLLITSIWAQHIGTRKNVAAPAVGPVPIGVVCSMSDGTTQTCPLGFQLAFQNNLLRVRQPFQYTGVIVPLQADGTTYKLPNAGRNIEIFRNGTRMQEHVDYTLNQPAGTLVPLAPGWLPKSKVVANYLF